MKNVFKVIEINDKKIKVKNPILENQPDYEAFKLVEIKKNLDKYHVLNESLKYTIDRVKVALVLKREYQYNQFIVNEVKKEDIEKAIKKLNGLDLHGLYIITNQKGSILDYIFIDRNYAFNKNNEEKNLKEIKACHQRSNATSKVKSGQALGNKRIEAFKVRSNDWK